LRRLHEATRRSWRIRRDLPPLAGRRRRATACRRFAAAANAPDTTPAAGPAARRRVPATHEEPTVNTASTSHLAVIYRTSTTLTAAGIHADRQLADVTPAAVDGRTGPARDAPPRGGAA